MTKPNNTPDLPDFLKRQMTHREFVVWLASGAAAAFLASCGAVPTLNPTRANLRGKGEGEILTVNGGDLQLVEQNVILRAFLVYHHAQEERDLRVNGYTINGDPNTRVYEVVGEELLPGQGPFALGWWTPNVLTDAISDDGSIARPHGDSVNIRGYAYYTFAPGENVGNIASDSGTLTPSGPTVFIAFEATPQKA